MDLYFASDRAARLYIQGMSHLICRQKVLFQFPLTYEGVLWISCIKMLYLVMIKTLALPG